MTQYFLHELEVTSLKCTCCLKIFCGWKRNAILYYNITGFYFQRLEFSVLNMTKGEHYSQTVTDISLVQNVTLQLKFKVC